MFQIQCLKSTNTRDQEFYAKYSIGPFIKGQSITIGNPLRRVLLSNLQGIAIVGVRISGIDHEYSTISNVKEDVVDILLNLKQIVLTGNITKPILARLSANVAGIIIAEDILLPRNISLVNPKQYIACLNNDCSFEMELIIARGQNYLTSGQLNPMLPEKFLAVDAVFMPVKKVNFFIEESKNITTLNSENLESLILEIWTNGGIVPDEALSLSAHALEKTFGLLKIDNFSYSTSLYLETSLEEKKSLITESPIQTDRSKDSKRSIEKDKSENFKTISIEILDLPVRPLNCLKRSNINTVFDLLQYSENELLELPNFGQKSAVDVRERLKIRFNINLRKF